jgi:flagellar basal body-associated protein FliL
MADQKQETEVQDQPATEKKSLLENRVVVLGAIVIVQAILAIALTQFVIVPQLSDRNTALAGAENLAAGDMVPEMGVIVGLEEIIVSLQSREDKGASTYLRINVNLEVDTQKTADLVVTRLPQLRDIVIMTLATKQAVDLSSPAGTQEVRSEIFKRLAEKLPDGSLQNIFFSDLVIQ